MNSVSLLSNAYFCSFTARQMKFHRPLFQSVIQALQQIFVQGMQADKAVEQALRDGRLGSRDRRFIAENVYGMVRWWRLINEVAGNEKKDPNVQLLATWLLINEKELPDWDEFRNISAEEIQKRYVNARKTRKIRESVPDWLDEVGSNELGIGSWEKELSALNEEAKVVLRVNGLKGSRDQVKADLEKEGILTNSVANYSDALILEKRQNIQSLKGYKNGFFEIQDASSQLVAPFMDLEENMTVVDACAGAGGKSLHMSSLMKNKGKIISMDVEERKLVELKKRADRAGVKIIQTQLINPSKIVELKEKADRVLLDVPCSGLGVLKRNPDAKWKLSPEFMTEIRDVQQRIIREYSTMLKPGGILVYATCSILPSENQEQVEKFLKENKGFEFIIDRKVMPNEGFDGFYMAKMKKD